MTVSGGAVIAGGISIDDKRVVSKEYGAATPGLVIAPVYVFNVPKLYHYIRGDCTPQ